MKKLLFTISLVAYSSGINAQGVRKTFDDCFKVINYKIYYGDTVIISCDSLIMMNHLTFNRYSTAYDRLKNNNGSTLEVFHRYDTLIADQQKRIMEQSQEYGALKFEYDSLSRNTENVISFTQRELQAVSAILDSTSRNLNETKLLLVDAQDKIRNEKYQRLKSKFSWGVGGLGVGFGLSALFFLLYQ